MDCSVCGRTGYETEPVSSVIVGLLRLNPNYYTISVTAEQTGVSLLATLASASDTASEMIGQQGGVQTVLQALRSCQEDKENVAAMSAMCCKALFALATQDMEQKQPNLAAEGAISVSARVITCTCTVPASFYNVDRGLASVQR